VEQKKMSSNPEPWCLTTEGWFQAQRVSGRFDSENFQKRRGRLCAAMKRAVDGRRDHSAVGLPELAQAAELPEGWVWNVSEAQAL
jgi:hypothetical protein